MIQELIYPDEQLPPHLKCQILCILRMMWPEGFTGQNRLRDWISAEGDHSISIMLVENDILISHTQVVWKYLSHAGETYKTYGLSGVLTYPAFRKQGYGRQIVDRGTAYIDATDADIAMFHCDKSLKTFYSASGWTPMETAITYVGPKDHPVVSSELLMMRFLSGHGKKSRQAFETIPFYFGEDTW